MNHTTHEYLPTDILTLILEGSVKLWILFMIWLFNPFTLKNSVDSKEKLFDNFIELLSLLAVYCQHREIQKEGCIWMNILGDESK